ncbi:Retrovirus-related Pol polyprotein [Stylophora pistillata]|uniref:Retrovirus-related Pol polyprotein n=1 Tax=Stylophora pistillata TaxID=50429 RepID=A0A2B4SDV8_STYPI|nr:Retrovirus-related Pol polyprotein [Stylophora pistillata]
MEDYVDPTKLVDSNEFWIAARRPKDGDKGHPARWLSQLSEHYLGEEPIIQSTHNFLRLLKQEPVGRGASLASALGHHDRTVLKLLERVSEHNLSLNPEKVKFKTDAVPFMGHVLTPEGLKPSAEIVAAILDMPCPEDKAATRRFIGTINYLSRFCPHLSEIVGPLRELTRLNQAFLWADQHTEAFTKAKDLVAKAPCLRYFDVHSPVVPQVDASDYGLGASLLQPTTSSSNSSDIQWQPVAFSSSSLTPTEQRYAQIEKHALAIVHGFHKFDQFLFGKANITVQSDHKPLETIFKKPLASAPRRLQSMMLSLQRYSFRVEYHKGVSLHIADTLSRAPLPMTSHKQMHEEFVYHTEIRFNSPDLSGFQDATLQEIRAASSTDPELTVLRPFIESGWPNDKAAVPALA